jgi:glycosyltransferase involved in cell wall biosynthesis
MSISPEASARPHVLIYEPRVEGHHVFYLRIVTEDLLGAGYRLTLAIDDRPEPLRRIRERMGDLMERVRVVSARPGRGGILRRIARCMEQSGADLVFLDNFDEIGSSLMRQGALGLPPPASLRGRIGGIYHRPRFLADFGWSPNQWIKMIGFERLLRDGWFSHLFLLDPYLHRDVKARWPDAPIYSICDPFPDDFAADRGEARRAFGLPDNKRVFLFYGTSYRRKGLALVVRTLLAADEKLPAFLLCAGQQTHEQEVTRGLETLVRQGRAKVINRYVSAEEEKQLFAASDVVLLPYINHFGISGILVRAIGAGVPVIASDEQLIGRLVREHGLGPLFASGDTDALRGAIERMAEASAAEIARWRDAAAVVRPTYSRAAFRDKLVGAFDEVTGKAALAVVRGVHAGAYDEALISVIVATYNRPDALDAVLRSLSRQTDRNFEIVVADDGSGPATRRVIEEWKARMPMPLTHVWHEDRGFRLAEIRNRAILRAAGDYCIFLDGDCIARPDFVASHRRYAEAGWFVAGNRAMLSRELTERILREGLAPETWESRAWLRARARGELNRVAPLLSVPLGALRRINAKRWRGARGGNLAIGMADLMQVDGFDAEFGGWGLEDSDIIVRLIRSGTLRKEGRFATGVLHLWHAEHDRSHFSANDARLQELLHGNRTLARTGLSALRAEADVEAAPVAPALAK